MDGAKVEPIRRIVMGVLVMHNERLWSSGGAVVATKEGSVAAATAASA